MPGLSVACGDVGDDRTTSDADTAGDADVAGDVAAAGHVDAAGDDGTTNGIDVDDDVGIGTDLRATAARALEATDWFDHYDVGMALSAEGLFVGRTTYEGYPIRRVETDHGTAFLEGRLYDVDDVEAHLERVAALLAADDVDALREWVGSRDGDFLLLVVDDGEVALLNDAFGRLPTYYATIDGTVVCSRELAYVREFARLCAEPLALDRLALGQYLCFGYPLGTRTTFEGVRAIPPGSLVWLDPGAAQDGEGDAVGSQDGDGGSDRPGIEIESLYEHDFDDCEHADRSVEENAHELVERIGTACQRRSTPERPTVISLSGGLDSRTVAGAYVANEIPATAATFQHADDRNAEEVAAAGDVAERLDLDWTVYSVAASPARRRTILDVKQGLNYFGMAYVLDFFEQLRDRHGTTTYVTGDGGDKLLVGLEPAKRLDTEAALVDYAIDVNARMSPDDAAAIANVEPEVLRASVARRIRSYPEADLARRYVHFQVRERGINFLVQGEDRNRYYAWSVSPFYALPVFEYAMNCPDDQKAYRRLQSAILERFDPGLVDLPYPNYGAPISTRRYRAKQYVYDVLERYPDLRQRAVDLVTSGDGDRDAIVDAIRADLRPLEAAGLSSASAAAVLATPEDYSRIQLQLLSTVSALASDLASERDRGERGDGERGVSAAAKNPRTTDEERVTGSDDAISVDHRSASAER